MIAATIVTLTSCPLPVAPRATVSVAGVAFSVKVPPWRSTRFLAVTMNIGPLVLTNIGPPPGVDLLSRAEARLIARKPSSQIEAALGYANEPELVHRDNLVLG